MPRKKIVTTGITQSERAEIREERIAKIAELLMEGHTTMQIVSKVRNELEWNLVPKTIYDYIHAANESFAITAKARAGEEFGKALNRLNLLFRKSYEDRDYKTCLHIQREINSMMGFGQGTGGMAVAGNVTNNNSTVINLQYIDSGKQIARSEESLDLNRVRTEDATFEEVAN